MARRNGGTSRVRAPSPNRTARQVAKRSSRGRLPGTPISGVTQDRQEARDTTSYDAFVGTGVDAPAASEGRRPKFVSPSRIARYYYHECERYLRYTSTPKEDRRAE